jgi:hypothetical protein
MDLGTDLDQASEGNVLCALNFEKVLPPPLHVSRSKHYVGFPKRSLLAAPGARHCQSILRSSPSAREPVVSTLQGIVLSVLPPSPAATPYLDDNLEQAPSPNIVEQTLQREQINGTGRARSGEPSVPPNSLPTDEGGGDYRLDDGLDGQH